MFFFAGRDAKYAIVMTLFWLRGLLLRHVGLYIFKVQGVYEKVDD